MGTRLLIPIVSVIVLIIFRICSSPEDNDKIVLCSETEIINCNDQQIYKLTPIAEFVSMNLCGFNDFDLKIIQNQAEFDSLIVCSGVNMSNIDLCGQTIIAGSVTCPDSSYEIVEAILTPECPSYNLTIIQKKTSDIGTLEKGSNDFIYILPALPAELSIVFTQIVYDLNQDVNKEFAFQKTIVENDVISMN